MKRNNILCTINTAFLLCIGFSMMAQGPFSIGTIHANDSIIVYYAVTVNTPLVPANTLQLSNQGIISGSNFANVPTDDPDTGPASDATITPLNSFPLPVFFTELKAYQKNADIEIAWKILTEQNTLKYEIEKSADGRTFIKTGEVTARGGNGIINYAFLDINPFSGNNFYRLKVIDTDGTFRFTSIVRVTINASETIMNLYPNPVSGNMFNLELRNWKKGVYDLNLYTVSGQKIYTTIIQHPGGSASQIINLPATISRGYYHVEVTGGNMQINKKLLVE